MGVASERHRVIYSSIRAKEIGDRRVRGSIHERDVFFLYHGRGLDWKHILETFAKIYADRRIE